MENASLLQKVDRNLIIDSLPRGSPFTHEDEFKYLRMLLGTNKFWKKKSLISVDGISTEVWKILSTGKLTQVVDDEKLACYWNVLVCSAFASNNAVLKIDDVEVSIDNIKLKEYVHIRTGIAEYAERVARKSANLVSAPAPTILASDTPVVMAPGVPIPTIPANR